ncbi:hypothetical protein [Methylobacterium sp. C1]|uniref:hypothetical protein n=1 Tax=Methylobacterium sp. C1 TaxID=1479019 RepID=UPI0013314621|nr:hypothetical protein [Methylobacterium sp. C1]
MDDRKFDIPVLNILSLGLDEAGKTVFLSALYNKFSVYNPSYGFSLQCEDESQKYYLTAMYNRISRPETDWPAGSMQHTEYVFNALHPTKDGSITFCKFNYLDYFGAAMRGAGDFKDVALEKRVREAHSILVLLDGRKIRLALEGKTIDDDIFKDLSYILPFLNLIIGTDKPVHFLISKSDLLPGGNKQLSDIQDLLFGYRPFKDYIKAQKHYETMVRMIPISSVGFEFAKLTEDGTEVQKISGGSINPHNVQFALSLAIHDHFWRASQKQHEHVKKLIDDSKMVLALMEAARVAPRYLLPRIKNVPSIIFWRRSGKFALTKILENIDQYLEQRQMARQSRVDLMQSAVTNRREAFLESLAVQREMVANLDKFMPGNNLAKYLES